MAGGALSTRTRKSAAERREEIVDVALRHFAQYGYHAANTEHMARDADLSQAYIFRLFGTKRDLFLACLERHNQTVIENFATAAAEGSDPSTRREAMGKAYVEMLQDRTTLRFQLQSYAACADDELRPHVRRLFGAVVGTIEELSGSAPQEVWDFVSHGMLLTVLSSLDLSEAEPDDAWARAWSDPSTFLQAE